MSIRFASFNASLNRSSAGQLISDLSSPDNVQAQAIAETIQRNNPDVVLINEFDFDAAGEAAALFQENYLSVSQNGVDPVEYPYVYVAPSNTGIPSEFDLNNDGAIGGPNDAFGFGFFPGQFGFAVFSKYPIVDEEIRTFQNFLWADMPGALLPEDPLDTDGNGDTANWFTPEELAAVRLSSKNHVDLPINVDGDIIHVLASHPTPPVFDGPEDLNGRRNHDEIRFWADYIQGASYIYDDAGLSGGLAADEAFVIMGDQNADPFDGDSVPGAIQQLLHNPLVNTAVTPASAGGIDAASRQGLDNLTHLGDPAFDTADFGETPFGPGNLRVDYALPSQNLSITDAGVFWLPADDPLFPSLNGDFPFPTSDHRLVYVDVNTAVTPGPGSVSGLDFLGEVQFPTGFMFEGTEVGGISGLAYDASRDVYYGLSDDRSQINPARFYTLSIDLSDGSLDAGDVAFEAVTTLLDETGNPYPDSSLDPEGIALSSIGTLYIASEGDANALINPFVDQFSLTGQQIDSLPIPEIYLPTADQSSGIRNNLAFESLTVSPNQQFLYTATENALFQDGPNASVDAGSPARILQYDLTTGEPVAEFIYPVEMVPEAPIPDGAFNTNGLVELLAVNDDGTLLALERGFSVGQGNTVKLFEIDTQEALNVLGQDSLTAAAIMNGAVTKRELLDIEADLGIAPDNLEALALGPVLPDGRQSLIIASDNNFNPNGQFTQFLAFAVDFADRETLPNGVASGDVTEDSIVLWTRSTELGEVTFEYSTEADFSTIEGTATAIVTDPLLPVKVEIEGLTANTAYYYRVQDAVGSTDEGQFKTAASLGDQVGLSFGVTGDWRGEIAPYPAITNVAEQNLDFFVEHGDTIYADFGSNAVLNPDGTRKQQAETLEEYRLKHNEVYSERFGLNAWEAVRASTAIYATIDDHEVINDFAGGAPAASDPRFPETEGFINDTALFENGLQAFQEYNPIRDEFYGETETDRTSNERKLYRSDTFGADAATFILDTRSFRDPVLEGPDTTDPADIARFLTESATLDRQFLGDVQLADLKADLLAAQQNGVTWKFIMVPEPIQELGLYNVDAFEGYAQERTEILKFVEENGIDNVVFVAADIHGTFVNNITYTEQVGGPRIATDVWEITTGSVGFDAPFGQTVIDIATATGLISPAERAFYDSLPIAPDTDDIINDKDDFLANAFQALAIGPGGFDPIGLDNNLTDNVIGSFDVEATLLQGDYVAAHTYGWTQFDIDPITQNLLVTTYGIEPYSEAELLADPEAILSRIPTIVSQFEVTPTGFDVISGTDEEDLVTGDGDADRLVGQAGDDTAAGELGDDVILGGDGDDVLRGDFNLRDAQVGAAGGDDIIRGGDGNDRIGGKSGNDFLYGDAGDDAIWGDDGDDVLRGGLGDDTLTGDNFSNGEGADTFVLAVGEGTDTIVDFEVGIDVIGLAAGLTFSDLTFSGNAILTNGDTLAIVSGVETTTLSESAFAVV